MHRRIEDGRRRSLGRVAVIALALGIIELALIGSAARAQEAAPLFPGASSDIRDQAGLFSADAIREARSKLSAIERATGAAVIIQTMNTLGGEMVDKVTVREAGRSGIRGLFVLIAKQERKLEVIGSGRYRQLLTEDHRLAIRKAFFQGFQDGDFNQGLKLGTEAIGKFLESPRPANVSRGPDRPAGASDGSKTGSPLVVRNQVRLTLAGAQAILAGAEAKARAMGLNVNIAVVDDGGHLLAFERMDQARPASSYTAISKAATAATMRQPSGPLPAGSEHPDPLLNLALEHAAASSGGKITTLRGGIPILVDGQVIGGVGVGGGTGEQDSQVARAGVQAFSDRLDASPAAPAAGSAPAGAARS